MPPPRRQPLCELPLSLYVASDISQDPSTSNAALNKRGISPSALLSPPKRRILAAEGLASPSKSPAKRLIFQSAALDTLPSSSVIQQNAGLVPSHALHLSRMTSVGSIHSSTSSAASLVSQTTLVHSPSKLSISTSSLPSTPPTTRSRSRPLAPSPEIIDSPLSTIPESHEAYPSRPASLKRLRSDGSTATNNSFLRSPTPKRRSNFRGISPAPSGDEEDLDGESEDKENIPPPKKKRIAAFKSPSAPARALPSVRDPSVTPRAARRVPDDMRARRAILEAEVDEPDCPGGF